jgi:hypothetical protein
VSTVHVTLGGAALATPRTTTLGPGEIGYLTYGLNNKGHKLLRAELGNQLGARLTVSTVSAVATTAPSSTTTPPSSTPIPQGSGGAGVASVGAKTTMGLISLVSFR